MTKLSMHAISAPVFTRMLNNLSSILSKAEQQAKAKGYDPNVLLNDRLAPDMFTLTRQVQIATDQVKGGMSRLAGAEVPTWPDTEASFTDLATRVDKALAHVKNFKPAQYEGFEARKIELKFPNITLEYTGRDYLLGHVLPNFYFHLTTAYAILRHNGVALGKRDFLGG